MIYPCTIKNPKGRTTRVYTTAELIARNDAEFKARTREQRKPKIQLDCPICGDHVTRQLKSMKTCSKAACVEAYAGIKKKVKRKGKL